MTACVKKITLILGGARSGKSTYAQQLAATMGGKVLFCATAEPLDDEMQSRIEQHRRSRPVDWDTVEASRDIGTALHKMVAGYDTVIIDCITLLVANCIGENTNVDTAEQLVHSEITNLINLMQRKHSSYMLVSNELGNGLVPENGLGRVYRDVLGKANQMLAAHADEVYLMVAGLPLKLK